MNASICRWIIALLLTAAGFSALGGCANARFAPVKPWQRGQLAGYMMNKDRDPLEVANAEHIYTSRESASGGGEVGGSGCGCN